MRGALSQMIAGTSLAAPDAGHRRRPATPRRARLRRQRIVGRRSKRPRMLAGSQGQDRRARGYRKATELAGEMKFDEAATAYRAVLAADPEMSDVWTQLALAYIRLGRSADAVDAFRHIIERDPKDEGALIGAAAELLRLNRYDEAQKYAELAVSVAPAARTKRSRALPSRTTTPRLRAARRSSRNRPTRRCRCRRSSKACCSTTRDATPSACRTSRQRPQALLHAHGAGARHRLLHRRLARAAGTLSRGRTLPEGRNRGLPVQHARARRPGDAVSRHGARRGVRAGHSRAARVSLRKATVPPLARQLWTMFGEPEKAAAVKKAGKSTVIYPVAHPGVHIRTVFAI